MVRPKLDLPPPSFRQCGHSSCGPMVSSSSPYMSGKILSPVVKLCFFLAASVTALADEPSQYRLEGTVTVEGTSLPLEGVVVQVLIESEPQPDKKIRSAKTNASGKYSVALPQGHAWAWYIRPPGGYTPVKALDLQLIATTPDLPVVVKNYQVRPGLAWNVEVRASEAAKPLPKIYLG